MSEYDIATFFVVAMALVTSVASRRLTGMYFTPIPVFWGSWSFMFVCGWLVIDSRLMPFPVESTYHYFWYMSAGAVVASILGLVFGRHKQGDLARLTKAETTEQIFSIAYPIYVVGMLALGGLHFIDRWQAVDFDFTRLYELRRIVMTAETASPISRLASYWSHLGMFLVVIRGLLDARTETVSTRTLFAMTLAGAPHGLAFGGRGWTLAPILAYGLSYFLAASAMWSRNARFLKVMPGILAIVAAGLLMFTVLGKIRSHDYNPHRDELTPDSWDVGTNLMFALWIGSSTVAIGPQAAYTEKLGPTWGQATFEYVTTKAQALGLVEPAIDEWLYYLSHGFKHLPRVGFTWCVPPTFIPYLVLDYGLVGLPIATAVLLFMLQWLCMRYVASSILGHTVALLCLMCAAMTIQTLNLFTSQTVLIVVIAAAVQVGAHWMRGGADNTSRYSASRRIHV